MYVDKTGEYWKAYNNPTAPYTLGLLLDKTSTHLLNQKSPGLKK